MRLVVQSELVANEPGPPQSADPRAAAALESPLQSEEFSHHAVRVVLVHTTKRSGLRMAAGMDHVVEGPEGTQTTSESAQEVGRVTVASKVAVGQSLRLVKFLAYGWSSQRSLPAVRDLVPGFERAWGRPCGSIPGWWTTSPQKPPADSDGSSAAFRTG